MTGTQRQRPAKRSWEIKATAALLVVLGGALGASVYGPDPLLDVPGIKAVWLHFGPWGPEHCDSRFNPGCISPEIYHCGPVFVETVRRRISRLVSPQGAVGPVEGEAGR